MRLRKSIQRPRKLQSEAEYGTKRNDTTRPEMPELLQSQVVPFNPNLPPAVFPSIPFPTVSSRKGYDEARTRTTADAQASSDDDCEMSDAESFPTGFHPRTRNVPTFTSPVDASLEDEMASSDDGDGEGDGDGNDDDDEIHPQPSDTQVVDKGHINPQVIISNIADWKDLCPAVQLAIISRMSECHSMSKVYDMLGLYAQELGDMRRLVAQYNYQSEMEDHLIFWMQKDQLGGILRTDHTSTARGAPEAYQEFQTRSYMHKIQAEIDERLLQATRAELNLGKMFLGRQGVQRDMIGYWGHVSTNTYAAVLRDRHILLPDPPIPVRSGLDSGYVSAVISPDKASVAQNTAAALVSGPRVTTNSGERTELTETSRRSNKNKVEGKKPAISIKQPEGRERSARPYSASPVPTDNASAAGSNGRSLRNIRRKPEYDAAIALGLAGSGGEGDSESGTSDESEQGAKPYEPRAPLPRLFITSDNKIRGGQSTSSMVVVSPESSARRQKTSIVSENTSQSPSRGIPTSRKRISSPLPLTRVVLRPPATRPKTRQPEAIAQPVEDLAMTKSNQNLLVMHKEGNNLTNSMMRASERDMAEATPWVAEEPQNSPSMANQGGNPRKTKAPAFSPISESFPTPFNRVLPGSKPAIFSSPNSELGSVDLSKLEMVTKGSLPATPDFTSTPASESPFVARNERSIVTETGSPVPVRIESTCNPLPSTADSFTSNLQHFTTTDRKRTADTPVPPPKVPHLASKIESVHRRLDPITGNLITDQPVQHHQTRASPPTKRRSHPSSAQSPHHTTPFQAASEGAQKAATTQPLKTSATPSAMSQDWSTPPRDGTREKRKYRKSEAQRRKEAELAERRDRERKPRDPKLPGPGQGRKRDGGAAAREAGVMPEHHAVAVD